MEEYEKQLVVRERYEKTKPCICSHGLGCHDTGGGECMYTHEHKCSCEHYKLWDFEEWRLLQ